MNILLLNWKQGENDPFTYFNQHLKMLFENHGSSVDILEVDGELGKNILDLLCHKRIHIAITHQGIGSNYRLKDNNKLLWEEVGIRLVCLHGDHPSFAPSNHTVDSKYVTHTYCIPAFASYANKNFNLEHPAVFLPLPLMFSYAGKQYPRVDDFFVLPKNHDEIDLTFQNWQKDYPAPFSEFLINTAIQIRDNYLAGDILDHHEIINNNIHDEKNQQMMSGLNLHGNPKIYHLLHGELDKIYRNSVSESIIEEMKDFPLVINGRGWEKFSKRKYKQHTFNEFGEVQYGEQQFYSAYGIIDVVSQRHCLHDRTMRALANRGGFLSNCTADFFDYRGQPFTSLFYNGIRGVLRERAEAVMLNPKAHIERCSEFLTEIQRQHPFDHFYKFMYHQYLTV